MASCRTWADASRPLIGMKAGPASSCIFRFRRAREKSLRHETMINTHLMPVAGRVLVVDDEIDFARGLCRLISGQFAQVECAYVGSGDEALAELNAHGADLMITDLRMPGMDGL